MDGVQPLVGEQSPDEPRFEGEAHSRVEALPPDGALLLEARPLDEAQSLAEALLPDVGYFLGERSFHAELHSPPDEARSLDEAYSPSQARSADEAPHCAVAEYSARQCRDAERCSPDALPASLAELRHV